MQAPRHADLVIRRERFVARQHPRPLLWGRVRVGGRAVVSRQRAESSMRGRKSISFARTVSSTPSRLRNTSSLVKRTTAKPWAARAAERAASRAISSLVECVAPSTSKTSRASKHAKSAIKPLRTTWRRNRNPETC
jgi:hypothetical protein